MRSSGRHDAELNATTSRDPLERTLVIHFSCDGCGRGLTEERYTLAVEMRAEHDPNAITEADLDSDHLAQIASQLDEETLHGQSPASVGEEPRVETRSYDLCPDCRERFLADPFGLDVRRALSFSQN